MTVELNYKKIGVQGEILVILHGLFGSLDNWQTMARKLSDEGYQVYTVDLRNHGKSIHTDDATIQLMAKDVAAFIRANGLSDITLIGHSMGGKTAMQLAFSQPELIKRLVVVDIAPKPYLPHHNTYFEAMLAMDLSAIKSRKEAQEVLKQNVKNIGVLQFLLKNLDRKKEGGFEWKFNLKSLYENYDQLLSGIISSNQFLQPSLFMRGALSDYISNSDFDDIVQSFPKATLSTIEGAGHWIHAEAPNEFFNSLTNFLKST